MDKLYFIFETSQSLSDTGIGSTTEQEVSESNDVYRVRVDWVTKKSVPDNCRYEIVSESQFPPDFDNYSWDYYNYDGIGELNSFTQSLNEYVTQSLSL